MNSFSSVDLKPLYEQLAIALKEKINSGIYPTGSKLPTEDELTEQYGVSRITVRKAVSILAEEGAVEKKQGKGTFVLKKSPGSGRRVHNFEERCSKINTAPSYETIEKTTCFAPDYVCAGLEIKKDSRAIKLVRILLSESKPVILETLYFSMAYSYLLESDLSKSIYEILELYSVKPGDAVSKVGIARADRFCGECLKISEGDPVLHIRETVYDVKERPLHFSEKFVVENFTMDI